MIKLRKFDLRVLPYDLSAPRAEGVGAVSLCAREMDKLADCFMIGSLPYRVY